MVQLPFDGLTVAVTGASGSLGQALLRQLHGQGATLVALTSRGEPLELSDDAGRPIPLRQVVWRCGEEAALEPVLADCHVLVINHGFNSHGDRSAAAVERSLSGLSLVRLPLPYEAGFIAAQAFVAYRRGDGAKRSPLPDFYIGAHAQTANLRLLTRDASRYRTYFPKVRLITPE